MPLVEGVNDCHAVYQLIRLVRGTEPSFGIHECGNDDKVLDSLAARVISARPKQKVLGLILDADIDGISRDGVIQSRRDQIADKVGDLYEVPAAFPEDGLILTPKASIVTANPLPKLGVWLMPNNKAFGMFEDLLMSSLPEVAADYTTKVVKQSKRDGIAKYKDTHLSKAVIRTYMAWQDPPDVQYLGLAIQKGAFERVESECQQLLDWLTRLFNP